MSTNGTNEILKEILKWQRLQGLEDLRKKVKQGKLFKNAKYISIYYYSDGSKSSREIGKITGITFQTITDLWKKWINAGIAEPTEKYGGGRCRRLFELNELDLKLPKNKNKVKE